MDWIHLPVLDRSDDAFLAPLAALDPHGARVYLGVIHNMERFDERVAIAHTYLPDFGLRAYCGFGRLAPSKPLASSTITCGPPKLMLIGRSG